MSTIGQYRPFPWARYSKKLALRIEMPCCVGVFTKADAEVRNLRFARGAVGSVDDGNAVALYWLVDPEDGVIIDARFSAFGNSALIGACEIVCELVIGKNYDQARRIRADLIDKHVQEKGGKASFPEETYPHLNLVVDAIEEACLVCQDIPLAESYVAPPIMSREIEVVDGGYPGWRELTIAQKLAVLEQVIAEEVRPYIELDAGGVEVINFLNDKEVIIAYQGTCTSCHSSTGATLSFIQEILRAKVCPDLDVIPTLPG